MTKLISINPKTNVAVLSHAGVFVLIDTDTKDVINTQEEFTIDASKGWVVPTQEPEQVWVELAQAATTSLSINDSAQSASSSKVFRVPHNIQKESETFSAPTTTLETIHQFYLDNRTDTSLVSEWVNKIVSKFPVEDSLVAAGFTPEPTSVYYGRIAEPNTTICDALYSCNADGAWAVREGGEWIPIDENPVEMYSLILLDPESATALADRVDNPDELDGHLLELASLLPHEFGLFYSAESEIDYELLDMLFDVYDSTERSINAKKQVRGPGGRFAPKPGGGEADAEKPKARLSVSLPLIPDIGARIDQYLADVKKQRGESQGEDPEEKSKFSYTELEFAITAEQAGAPTSDVAPLYIAIVDNIDTDAVLDLVSLVPPAPGVQGDVSAWKRANGQWVAAPEILSQLRGSTPPSCVEVSDPDVLKEIVAQIDKSTHEEAEAQKAPGETELDESGNPVKTETTPRSAPVEMKKSNFNTFNYDTSDIAELAARGYCFQDGTLLIRNSDELRQAVAEADNFDKQLHCIKRARALNRIDLIPSHWSVTEASIEEDLWGPYGELIPISAAGGWDRNRGDAERLRHYWTRGIGGAKIAWGTPRDWTRCVAYLSKYLGPRARGYCALRHKEMNGYWPGDKRNK